MAVDERHIRQAEHNEAVYHHLDTTSDAFGDWQTTALFYAALHYANAYLFRQGVIPRDHDQRAFWVRTERRLRMLHAEYTELQDRGWESRYGLVTFSRGRARQLYAGSYRPFRNSIRHTLNLLPVSEPSAGPQAPSEG